jgi:hypothetical protein
MGPNRSLTAEFVKELRDGRYRWIVALRTAASDILSAAGAIPLSQRYEDNDYVVFHADR